MADVDRSRSHLGAFIRELDYPPFELGPHLFDGRVLAFYLVSTG